MKIVTKREADVILAANPKARRFLYDGGKYELPSSQYVGREVRDIDGVLAVYPERRQDQYGGFIVLRSITLN